MACRLLAHFRSFHIAAAAEAGLQSAIGSKRGSELYRWLGEEAVKADASNDAASGEGVA